jgi:hypothetical protein
MIVIRNDSSESFLCAVSADVQIKSGVNHS